MPLVLNAKIGKQMAQWYVGIEPATPEEHFVGFVAKHCAVLYSPSDGSFTHFVADVLRHEHGVKEVSVVGIDDKLPDSAVC